MTTESKKMISPRVNKVGQSYGHWIVKSFDEKTSQEKGKVYWLCECDCGCGTTKSIRADALRQVVIGGCNNMLSTVEKECCKCHKKFFAKKQAKTRQYCYDCMPEEAYSNGNTLRRLIKRWSLDYKGNSCFCCGYHKCPDALEFHHLDPSKKDFSISDRNIKFNWEDIQKELDKCILVCSNCHKEIHAGMHPELLDYKGE